MSEHPVRQRGNDARKALALLAVGILLATAAVALVDVGSGEGTGDVQTVVYHRNGGSGGDESVAVTYYGIAATEYSPTAWKGTFTPDSGSTENWKGPSATNSGVSVEKVFAGWSTFTNPSSAAQVYDPGDVIPSNVTELYAFWVTPSVTSDGKLTAAWNSRNVSWNDAGDVPGFVSLMYLRHYTISGNVSTNDLATGTYEGSFKINGKVVCGGDVIIDGGTITSIDAGQNHGYGSNGIYANGHKLILGANVETGGGSAQEYPEIFGGGTGETTTVAAEGKSVVSKDSKLNGMKFDMGSFVIVHGGTYYAIMAGGKGDMGSDSHPLSTYLVIKKATVVDTVGGGTATDQAEDNVFGASGKDQSHIYSGGPSSTRWASRPSATCGQRSRPDTTATTRWRPTREPTSREGAR